METAHGLTNVQINVVKNVIFNDVEAIVHILNPLAHLIKQADGLQGRGTGFHGNLISVQKHSVWICKPRRKRLAANSSERFIDCARMYPPGFAVYITLGAQMNKNLLVLILIGFLVGCNDENTKGVKGTKGETPVRYVICGAGETNCFVGARFKDLDGCETHKKWSEMLCDSQSDPRKMICEKDSGAQIAFSYCTL